MYRYELLKSWFHEIFFRDNECSQFLSFAYFLLKFREIIVYFSKL